MDEKFPEAAVTLKDHCTSHPLKFDPKNGSHSRHFELSQEIQSLRVTKKLPSVISSICIIKRGILRNMPPKLQTKPTSAIC